MCEQQDAKNCIATPDIIINMIWLNLHKKIVQIVIVVVEGGEGGLVLP